jgi:hypothetical protein
MNFEYKICIFLIVMVFVAYIIPPIINYVQLHYVLPKLSKIEDKIHKGKYSLIRSQLLDLLVIEYYVTRGLYSRKYEKEAINDEYR